jgi:hypothetical protein
MALSGPSQAAQASLPMWASSTQSSSIPTSCSLITQRPVLPP